jgi:probable O-glycosylation ligase (exosortase A-associated)
MTSNRLAGAARSNRAVHDLALIGFLVSFIALGFRRPFIFVLAYAYVDIVSPQRLSYYLLNSVPVSLISFGLAILSWSFVEDKRNARFTARQGMMIVLLLYCWMTTVNADFMVEAAEKWSWVWKALVFAIFLPLTLTTRLRIEALALVMTLSAGSIIIVGGIKTLASGGGYGVLNLMVDNNSGLYESSTIATVAIAIIPLILYLMKHGTVYPPDWRVKTFCLALCFASVLIPIGTEARTGLICIGILGVMMLRSAKRPILYIMMAGVLGLSAIPFLPETFMKRMDTINEYKADSSASTRIAVWKWTWDYVQLHPTGGGFDAYRQNSVRYETAESESATVDDKRPKQAGVVVDQSRAYHSAYFEMLGEQGFPGLIMWLLIHGIGIFRMEALYRRYRKRGPEDGEWIGALASALQQGHIIYMFGSIFVGIAFQPFVYMLVGMQIGLDSYAKRREQEARWKPLVNRKAVPQGV